MGWWREGYSHEPWSRCLGNAFTLLQANDGFTPDKFTPITQAEMRNAYSDDRKEMGEEAVLETAEEKFRKTLLGEKGQQGRPREKGDRGKGSDGSPLDVGGAQHSGEELEAGGKNIPSEAVSSRRIEQRSVEREETYRDTFLPTKERPRYRRSPLVEFQDRIRFLALPGRRILPGTHFFGLYFPEIYAETDGILDAEEDGLESEGAYTAFANQVSAEAASML